MVLAVACEGVREGTTYSDDAVWSQHLQLKVGVVGDCHEFGVAWPPVSASSPLVGFGKLNDNTIKGLISLLSVEQEIKSIAYTCGLCINKYIQGSTSRQT